MPDDLDSNSRDKIVATARGALAAIPFAGGLLGELLAEVIPGQRQDRIVQYLRQLEERISAMEGKAAELALQNPEKIDLIERGGRQAAVATSPERISAIVEVVARGLVAEDAETVRRKRLLNLLAEIDEDELAILNAYGRSYAGGDRTAWHAIDIPDPPTLGGGIERAERAELYQAGKDNLQRLGLLKRNFGNIKKGQTPEFDPRTGTFKHRLEISFLGRMLLKEVGLGLSIDS